MTLRAGIVALLLAMFCVPAIAAAQDEAPYSPRRSAPSDLIVTDRFSEPPLAFPWQMISTDRQFRDGRNDFVVVYNIPFSEVREILVANYQAAEDFIELRAGALNYTGVELMRIAGTELGDNRGRITIGHPDLGLHFAAEFEADGPRTRVTILNRTTGRTYAGFVPARVGFRPDGAQTIPFRGN